MNICTGNLQVLHLMVWSVNYRHVLFFPHKNFPRVYFFHTTCRCWVLCVCSLIFTLTVHSALYCSCRFSSPGIYFLLPARPASLRGPQRALRLSPTIDVSLKCFSSISFSHISTSLILYLSHWTLSFYSKHIWPASQVRVWTLVSRCWWLVVQPPRLRRCRLSSNAFYAGVEKQTLLRRGWRKKDMVSKEQRLLQGRCRVLLFF